MAEPNIPYVITIIVDKAHNGHPITTGGPRLLFNTDHAQRTD